MLARHAGWWLAVLFATPACAQVSGSFSLLSDDRYRGVSLSDGAPTAQATIDWDGTSGWYGGVQFTHVRLVYPHRRDALEAAPYFGYVRSVRPGLRMEAGVQYTWFSHSSRYAYPEVYVGLSGDRLHGRLAWIHHDFGKPATAWYGELDGDWPVRDRWRAIAHVGLLRQGDPGGDAARAGRHWGHDIAAGIAVTMSSYELQAIWTTSSVGATGDDACAPWRCGAHGLVMRLSHGW